MGCPGRLDCYLPLLTEDEMLVQLAADDERAELRCLGGTWLFHYKSSSPRWLLADSPDYLREGKIREWARQHGWTVVASCSRRRV